MENILSGFHLDTNTQPLITYVKASDTFFCTETFHHITFALGKGTDC